MTTKTLGQHLLSQGLINTVGHGIQIDINVAKRKMPDDSIQHASLCDHNCTTKVGNYDCPAAFSHNSKVIRKLSSADTIIQQVEHARTGIHEARNSFLLNGFEEYCRRFAIPREVAHELKKSFENNVVEVNLFGGNPEMHDDLPKIIATLKKKAFRVTLTTTGRRFMKDTAFAQEMRDCPPDVLALSTDDCDLDELQDCIAYSPQELQEKWDTIPKMNGQEQKFLEALYAAHAMKNMAHVRLVFNMVMHEGNISVIRAIMQTLRTTFSQAFMNPYPAQSAFMNGSSEMKGESLNHLKYFVDEVLEQMVKGESGQVPRLHYWLVLKTVFEAFKGNNDAIAKALAGYETWQCYRNTGNMYLQIGRGPQGVFLDQSIGDPESGHPGCFWNHDTVTDPCRIISDQQVAMYLTSGAAYLGRQAKSPCQGCLMPRLMFGMITTELGLNPQLIPTYLQLRKAYAGF